jgi:hypothetical protein
VSNAPPSNALAKPEARDRLRSIWLEYRDAKPGWHLVVPTGLAVIAGAAITWAWTMLEQHEYAAAMLLVIFFLVIGIGAALAILNRMLKVLALVLVIVMTGFSVLKIIKEKGDQPWTRLWGADPYQLEMATTFSWKGDQPNSVAMFWMERRDQLKPIHTMFRLRLINRQSTVSMIQSYNVEMRVDGNRWVKLQKLEKGKTYYLAKSFTDCKGFTEAREMEFLSGFFEDAIYRKNIQPGETVEGWVFFQIPSGVSFSKLPFSSKGNYRLNLYDTSGRAFSSIIPFAKSIPVEDEAQPILLRKTANVRDLTPLVIGRYDQIIAGTTSQDGQPCLER